MSRSQPLWISLLGVALLAGFAFVLFYLFGFSEETPPPPAIAPTWSVTTPDALTRSDLATDIAGNRRYLQTITAAEAAHATDVASDGIKTWAAAQQTKEAVAP